MSHKPRNRMTNETVNLSSIHKGHRAQREHHGNTSELNEHDFESNDDHHRNRLRDFDQVGIKSSSENTLAKRFHERFGCLRHFFVFMKSVLDVRGTDEEAAAEEIFTASGTKKRGMNEREYAKNFKTVVFGTRLNVLLLFGPCAVVLNQFEMSDGVAFALALLALCPLAERLGFVTEEMAKHTSQTIGGLLNATFGNATEMIVSVFALRDGLLRVVQLSLVGSIFSNMLLVLGCAFFAGGVKWKEQRFNKRGAMTNSSLLCLAVMGVTLPNALHATHTELHGTVSELALSRFSAILLLIMYVVFLYFQLVSHTDFFEDEPDVVVVSNDDDKRNNNRNNNDNNNNNRNRNKDVVAANKNKTLKNLAAANEIEEDDDNDSDDDDDDEEPELGFTEAIYYMGAITLFISILSDVIVSTIEGAARSWNCPVAFISVVMLPIVGNAAEHASAVMFALKNKMDISIGVAIGSSTQIAMFVFPFCVLVSWAMNKPLDLNMKVFETISLVLCVVTVTFCIRDGKGNWLKGLTLILAYVILAASFFFHAEPPAEGLAGTSMFRLDDGTK